MEARTVHVGSAGTADPRHSAVDAVRPWRDLTPNPHTSKMQDPDVDNSSLSEPLWDSGGEHHSVPESWVHDVELPNLQKKAYRALQPPPARRSFRIKGIWRKWAAVLAEGGPLSLKFSPPTSFCSLAWTKDFAVEGDEVGTPGTAEGPADLGADENWTRGASELEEAPPRVTQTSILSPTGAPHWSCSLHVRREWDQLWYLPPENGRLKAASTSSILVSPEAKAR